MESKLVSCSTCGNQMAKSAEACPKCGAKNTWIHPEIQRFIDAPGMFGFKLTYRYGPEWITVTEKSEDDLTHGQRAARYAGKFLIVLVIIWFMDSLYYTIPLWMTWIAAPIITGFEIYYGVRMLISFIKMLLGSDSVGGAKQFTADYRGLEPKFTTTDAEKFKLVTEFFRKPAAAPAPSTFAYEAPAVAPVVAPVAPPAPKPAAVSQPTAARVAAPADETMSWKKIIISGIVAVISLAVFLKRIGVIGSKTSSKAAVVEQESPPVVARTPKESCEIENHRNFYCHYVGRLAESNKTVAEVKAHPDPGNRVMEESILILGAKAAAEYQANIDQYRSAYQRLTGTKGDPSCANVLPTQDCDALDKKVEATPAPTAAPVAAVAAVVTEQSPAPIESATPEPVATAAPTPAPVETPVPTPAPVAVAAPVEPTRPSFDCAKASNDSERAICANNSLSVLDKKLNTDYVAAYRASKTKRFAERCMTSLKQAQLKWMKQRNGCRADVGCLTREMESRISGLSRPDPACN